MRVRRFESEVGRVRVWGSGSVDINGGDVKVVLSKDLLPLGDGEGDSSRLIATEIS
jgi:hypothetical protein